MRRPSPVAWSGKLPLTFMKTERSSCDDCTRLAEIFKVQSFASACSRVANRSVELLPNRFDVAAGLKERGRSVMAPLL